MAKKYTRKQLKQPDEFITFSMQAWRWVQERIPHVLVAIGVAVVIIAGAYGWNYLSTKKAMKTTAYFSKALDIYQKPLWTGEGNFPPPSEDGVPQFKSHKEKMAAVEKEISDAEKSSSGKLHALALLMKAGALYDLRQYDSAVAAYQQYLDKTKDHRFDELAFEGLAYCHEALKNYDRAIEYVRRLSQEGEKKYEAMYYEARLLALKGQKQESSKLFQQVISKAASSELQDRAGQQMLAMEK